MPASSEGGSEGKSNGGGRKRGWLPVWLGWGKKPTDDQPAESNAGSTLTGVRKESAPSSASFEGPATGMDGRGAAVSPAGAGTGAGSIGGAVGVEDEADQEGPRAENNRSNSEVEDTGTPSSTLLVHPGKTGAGDTSTGVRKEDPPPNASVEKLVAGIDGGGAAVSATGAGSGAGSSGGAVGVEGEAGQEGPPAESGTINSEVKDTGIPSTTVLVQPGESGAGDSSTAVRKESLPSSASVEKLVAGMDGGGAALSATGAGTGGRSIGDAVGVGGGAGQGKPQAENRTITSEVRTQEPRLASSEPATAVLCWGFGSLIGKKTSDHLTIE